MLVQHEGWGYDITVSYHSKEYLKYSMIDIHAGTFKLKSTFKHFDRNGSGDIDIVRDVRWA